MQTHWGLLYSFDGLTPLSLWIVYLCFWDSLCSKTFLSDINITAQPSLISMCITYPFVFIFDFSVHLCLRTFPHRLQIVWFAYNWQFSLLFGDFRAFNLTYVLIHVDLHRPAYHLFPFLFPFCLLTFPFHPLLMDWWYFKFPFYSHYSLAS